MSFLVPIRRGLARFRDDHRGIAAVEMALVSTAVLIPMMGGIIGLGQALALQNRLDRALHAGLFTAWGVPTLTEQTTPALTPTMVSAVQGGYGSTDPAVTTGAAWYCISPTSTRANGSVATQTTTCPSTQVLAKYITIAASVSFIPLVNVPVSGWNSNGKGVLLTSTATVRVPCTC